jgi:hypothetical protein
VFVLVSQEYAGAGVGGGVGGVGAAVPWQSASVIGTQLSLLSSFWHVCTVPVGHEQRKEFEPGLVWRWLGREKCWRSLQSGIFAKGSCGSTPPESLLPDTSNVVSFVQRVTATGTVPVMALPATLKIVMLAHAPIELGSVPCSSGARLDD